MNTKFEKPLRTADPISPTPLSQPSSLRLFVLPSAAGSEPLLLRRLTAIYLLLRRIYEFLHVGPEHLILGVFQIAKPVALHGEDKEEAAPRPMQRLAAMATQVSSMGGLLPRCPGPVHIRC